jgi:hypothetical protein
LLTNPTNIIYILPLAAVAIASLAFFGLLDLGGCAAVLLQDTLTMALGLGAFGTIMFAPEVVATLA